MPTAPHALPVPPAPPSQPPPPPPDEPDEAGWPAAAARYLDAVEAELGGIDADEHHDLVEDLRAHIDALLEVDGLAAEGAPRLDLRSVLGPPEEYAAELLASAGIEPARRRRSFPRPAAWARRRIGAWVATPRVRAVREWLGQLGPVWWVARGFGLAAMLGVLTGGPSQIPVPDVLGNSLVGLVVTGGLIFVSVEHGSGRWRPRLRGQGLIRVAAGAVAVLTLAGLLLSSGPSGPGPGDREELNHLYQEVDRLSQQAYASMVSLTLPGGEPVTNIYAFDRDGRPLDDVLLYDGVGNPLVLQGSPDPLGEPFAQFGLTTDFARDATGTPIPNLYPLAQYRTGAGDPDTGATSFEDPRAGEAMVDDAGGDAVDTNDLQPGNASIARPRPEVHVPPVASD